MTTTTIAIAILAALAAMMLTGLILWQRQNSAQLKIMKNMERQLQELRQELEKLSHEIGEASDNSQQLAGQELEGQSVQPEEPLLKESASIKEETQRENVERTFETEALEEQPAEKALPELERLEAETTQDLENEALIEEVVLEQSKEADEDSRDVEADDLNSHIWSQLVELAEQEEQEQEEQGLSADDEKLMDLDQAEKMSDPSGYNVGKSGKIYTEEELELLIKE